MDRTREELLDDYETTVVVTRHPERGWVDPAPVAIERTSSAVVMTAWNPGHVRPTEEQNRAANDHMGEELRATGYEVWQADGRAPDGTWLEEGWIIWAMPVPEALAVASRYGQYAIYVYDERGRRTTIACPA